MLGDSWQKLAETDPASEEFPRLAIRILDSQRQTPLDVFQFTDRNVTQLIELIDGKVRSMISCAFDRGSMVHRYCNMRLFQAT